MPLVKVTAGFKRFLLFYFPERSPMKLFRFHRNLFTRWKDMNRNLYIDYFTIVFILAVVRFITKALNIKCALSADSSSANNVVLDI